MSKISLILKYLRRQKGIFQKNVANDINIETNTYGSWERGNTEPPIDMLIVLAKYFDVSVDYLVGIENEDYTNMVGKESINSTNAKETELVELFRQLNTLERDELLNFAHYLKSR